MCCPRGENFGYFDLRLKIWYNFGIMQTLTIGNNSKRGVFRRIITPDERSNSILIPEEWYGTKMEVTFTPVPPETPPAPKPFVAPRHRVGTVRASGDPAMLSENLIRADRDARG